MGTVELDPLFVKALKLLHSRHPDSMGQLKQMTDEAIAQRRGELALKKLDDEGKRDDTKYGHKGSTKRDHIEIERRRETEKRTLEKLKDDLACLSEDPIPVKKIKLEPSESKQSSWKDKESSSKDRERSRDAKESSHRDRKEREDSHKPTMKEDPSWLDFGHTDVKPKKSQEPAEKRFIIGSTKVESESSEEDGDSSNFPGLDAEQFATEMMDLACVVCKQIDMTSGNRLLDCQECHRLYHQECHRPPVSEDVDDPRFVWYCSKCSKNMKKMVKAQKPKSSQSSSSKEKETASLPAKPFKSEPSAQTPFRRLDAGKTSGSSKDGGSQSSSSSRPYTGLASLAANLSSKTHESSKSSRDSSSKQPVSSHTAKSDNSKGLGFLFKPDAHKITNVASQKSFSSSGEKGGLFKMSAGSSSGKSTSTGKSSTSSAKPSGMSLLAKSSGGSSSGKSSSSSGQGLSRSNSSSGGNASSTGSSASSGSKMMSSMMNADKKLQIMKKKAAARAAEKKSFR